MSAKGVHNYRGERRRDRMLKEDVHDPYEAKLKLKENSTCKSCNAVYKKGRWTWAPAPDSSIQATCPACQRIQDKVPAGFLSIAQKYFGTRKTEIMNLIRHTETRERQAHPLKRIINIDDKDELMQITFTDPRLARNIGDALKSAYGGKLDYQYTPGEFMLRVTLEV